MNEATHLIVFCTCPSRDEAQKLSRLLVKDGEAACVSLIPAIESVYRWKGNVETNDEFLLLIKTTAARYHAVERTIRQNHPYEVPEIIALPIVAGETHYLDWLSANCREMEE